MASNDETPKRLPIFDSSDVVIIIDEGPGDYTVRPIPPERLKSLPPGPWLDKLKAAGKLDQDNPTPPETEHGNQDNPTPPEAEDGGTAQ